MSQSDYEELRDSNPLLVTLDPTGSKVLGVDSHGTVVVSYPYSDNIYSVANSAVNEQNNDPSSSMSDLYKKVLEQPLAKANTGLQ